MNERTTLTETAPDAPSAGDPGDVDLADDDRPIGRVLSRREVLLLMGAGSGAIALAACVPTGNASPGATATGVPPPSGSPDGAASATPAGSGSVPSCVVAAEQTEGPYFVEVGLDRSDIRTDPGSGVASGGAPFALAFAVSRVDAAGCVPLEGALVDVWHCDADGRYSGVTDRSFNTSGQAFLRGSQVTDASGAARFSTIYPGWYQGRTVHVHFKIRTDPNAQSGTIFTSQLYFDDAFTDSVYEAAPYDGRGPRTTRNDGDGIYGQGGDQLLVPVAADGAGGYAGTFEIGIQLD